MEVCDLEIAVVDETLVVLGDSATHAVVGHGDEWRSGGVGNGGVDERPEDWAVFAIVCHRPGAGGGLYEGLVAVIVELGSEVINGCVLVKLIDRIDGIRAALGRALAVADVVKGVRIAVV